MFATKAPESMCTVPARVAMYTQVFHRRTVGHGLT